MPERKLWTRPDGPSHYSEECSCKDCRAIAEYKQLRGNKGDRK